jgi:formamidopyrimidine-DNA glycosylase
VPELVEVERYRRLAETVVGLRISGVCVLDDYMLRGEPVGTDLGATLAGRRVTAARRRGKVLLLDTGPQGRQTETGPTLGLRFGMTGTLLVDARAGVDRLLYAPSSFDE